MAGWCRHRHRDPNRAVLIITINIIAVLTFTSTGFRKRVAVGAPYPHSSIREARATGSHVTRVIKIKSNLTDPDVAELERSEASCRQETGFQKHLECPCNIPVRPTMQRSQRVLMFPHLCGQSVHIQASGQ
ncbi:unnamed protein product [Pleuronectes platessa]|uniref:Uncharacterized protein n=1 Tax=Pleuronectes platessa TaxID=8262 RepID=A0A9N7V7J1_PLEPL|nr:unnamed protein product [Pleuronectes platessa]